MPNPSKASNPSILPKRKKNNHSIPANLSQSREPHATTCTDGGPGAVMVVGAGIAGIQAS
jgi:hypothetical protein